MKLTDQQIIKAPRNLVWKGLNDPKVLQQCIPGCQEVVSTSPTTMKAKVVIKLGPVKAAFSGNFELSEIKAPESCRISGKGEGGLAGFATGGAFIKLTEIDANTTQMDYDVDAQIGGKMAMLGSRLINSTASSLAEKFFEKFASVIKAENAAIKTAPAKKTIVKKAIKKVATKATKKAAKKVARKK